MFTVLSTVFLLGTLVRAAPIQLDWLLDPLAMSSDIDAIIPTSTTPAAAGVDTTSFLEVTVTQTVLATVSTTSVASYIPLTSTIVPSPTTTASEAASTAAGTLSIPSSLAAGNDKIVAAYYPDWAGPNFPPEKIDFARFDWIDFAFALPNAQFGLEWDNEDGTPALLRRLVTAAHAKGKKVKLSVGGWTGSK
jgi:chitinase